MLTTSLQKNVFIQIILRCIFRPTQASLEFLAQHLVGEEVQTSYKTTKIS